MTAELRCGPGNEKPAQPNPPSDRQPARGQKEGPRYDDRLRPRLDERRIGHHPEWVFPHGNLSIPPGENFLRPSHTAPLSEDEEREEIDPGQAEAAKIGTRPHVRGGNVIAR